MIIKTIPKLSPGSILRQTALTAISDAAFLTNEHLFRGYADGILSGCGLSATRDTISVQAGAVLLDGQIFLIKDPLTIGYRPTDDTVALKMCFSDATMDADCVYREMHLAFTGVTGDRKGEIELCRFRLQEGARLRYEYQDLEDRSTEFDTMNRVCAPYAAYGRSTLSLDIMRAFAQEMMDIQESITDLDAAFCLQILGSSTPVAADAVIRYIQYVDKKAPEDVSNMGLFRGLTAILGRRRGTGAPVQTGKAKKWKMMME